VLVFDQIYSFDREALIKGIPKPENIALWTAQRRATQSSAPRPPSTLHRTVLLLECRAVVGAQ